MPPTDEYGSGPGPEFQLGSSSDPMPAPGDLHIKGKLTWKTWQVLAIALAALLVGFWLNYKPVGATSSTSKPAYTLPPSGGAATTTTSPSSTGRSTASTTTTSGGGSTTTTTSAGGSTTTSTSSSPSSSPAAGGPARVLLGPTQQNGNWTSPSFTTTAAGWNIGWAFRCSPAPASGPSFQVFATQAGSQPAGTAAISETGPSGQSVTAQSSLGAQTLVVQASASCTWAVKVTGS